MVPMLNLVPPFTLKRMVTTQALLWLSLKHYIVESVDRRWVGLR
ncbi:hypothetical protein MTR67_039211 [Solanum verrucosum]|uniref:Uncharacterized protein n=1 Tax=Solanum verrucosum TaxID=315347 RepID=A0AAF0ZNL6_SOLVR|nr:hypothetical protein MTR67_039211 [Solanum verrucosum]